MAAKKKEALEFKPRPMKREESDMQNFKQIFIDPRTQVLSQIQENAKNEGIVMAKQVCRDYERLLQFERGPQSNSPGKDREEINDHEVGRHFQEAIELLQQPHIDRSS